MPAQNSRGPAPLLVLNKISDILGAFSLARPELSLTEIREATGLPTSTVQRLVGNLVTHGFLDRVDDRYRVGIKMSYWAAPATQGVEILEILKPVLNELRDELGETVGFFQSSLNYRVCVAVAETHHMLRRDMRVGRILPLHAGSAGRVLLAWDPELAKRVLASELDQLTESTITDTESLRLAIEQTRNDGYAITTGERESSASGLSAPVFNAQADLVGALTIMGPTLRMPRELCDQWVEKLLEGAEQITRMTGGRWPSERGGPVDSVQ
ncbi:IclR family transcriptional regulator [Arthrobacter sp. H14]|uniref:IclR family transcriptional regulator n=1 Tax=Arthrobacter sp. H14 TaxID=1312959 RepID=UPI00047C0E14|nr:IclR family transcriptional regulator [Arthrobacter sp. H14]